MSGPRPIRVRHRGGPINLILVLREHDMVGIQDPYGTPVTIVHIDTFWQDDRTVYNALVRDGRITVKVELEE